MNLEDQKALDRLGATVSVQTDEVVQPQQKYPRLQKLVREVFAPALVAATLLTSMGAAAYHQRSRDADAAIPPLSIPSQHIEAPNPEVDQSQQADAAIPALSVPSPHVEVPPPEEKAGPSIITIIIQDGETWSGLAELFSIPPGEWEDWKNQMIAYNNEHSEAKDISGNKIDFTILKAGQEVELFTTGPFEMIVPG